MWEKGREKSRVGSDFVSTIAGRVGSGQRLAGPGWVGSKKSDPWTTLMSPMPETGTESEVVSGFAETQAIDVRRLNRTRETKGECYNKQPYPGGRTLEVSIYNFILVTTGLAVAFGESDGVVLEIWVRWETSEGTAVER